MNCMLIEEVSFLKYVKNTNVTAGYCKTWKYAFMSKQDEFADMMNAAVIT